MRTIACFVIEQELGERARQFGFADAGRAEENERADGTVGVFQSRAGAHHGVGHRLDGFVLADDALVQFVSKLEQFLHFAFEQFGHRDAGPAADHLRRCPLRPLLL